MAAHHTEVLVVLFLSLQLLSSWQRSLSSRRHYPQGRRLVLSFHLPLLIIRSPNFRAANRTNGPSVNFTIAEINSIFQPPGWHLWHNSLLTLGNPALACYTEVVPLCATCI